MSNLVPSLKGSGLSFLMSVAVLLDRLQPLGTSRAEAPHRRKGRPVVLPETTGLGPPDVFCIHGVVDVLS